MFNYGDMQWTTGDASNGASGFGGAPATAGINKGNNLNFVEIGVFNQNNSNINPAPTTSGVNYLDNKSFIFNVTPIANFAPSVTGIPTTDTVRILCGNTDTISLTFMPPEINQLTTTTVDTSASFCNATAQITNGLISTAQVIIKADACNAGTTHTLTFTSTDNYSVPATTIVKIIVKILPLSTTIIPDTSVCFGTNLTLTASGGNYYRWTGPGGFTSSLQNPTLTGITPAQAGQYTVSIYNSDQQLPTNTLPSNGCAVVASTNIAVNPLPGARIDSTGEILSCTGISSVQPEIFLLIPMFGLPAGQQQVLLLR
jgi:hypothetical protein